MNEEPPQPDNPPSGSSASGPDGAPTEVAAFPLVGVGASAGGLEALTQLLRSLPADTGMGFVIIQHLDPTHASNLVDLLGKATSMPVRHAADGMRVEPNQVYVIPPNTNLTIQQGVLHLAPRGEHRLQHMPVDCFFRSLAEDFQSQAIGVVLSGTATDGTLGLSAIKEHNGIAFAQDASAKYGGMPRSAVAAGCVDFVLPPEKIAAELVKIGQHPFVRPSPAAVADSAQPDNKDSLGQIFRLLRHSSGVDFRHYKHTTIQRRIKRRMVLHEMGSLEEYLNFLREHPAEVQALYQDILIQVTGFFRDSKTFEALKTLVFPRFTENRPANLPIRIWVPACSTGEEAYSLAICLLEFLGDRAANFSIKLFATDVSEAAIIKARAGLYPETVTQEVSQERLRRFFIMTERGYQICKAVRELCVFARQDITKDAPFSQLDLITCRNALIYLDTVLQKRVFPLFHYALKPGGFLLLGSSETVGGFSDLFAVIDNKHKLYAKKLTHSRLPPDLATGEEAVEGKGADDAKLQHVLSQQDVHKEADRVVLARYAPAGVVVNDDMEILQFRGKTGAYLEPAAGAASFNLLKMAREGLLAELRGLINLAKRSGTSARKEQVRIQTNGNQRTVSIEVISFKTQPSDQQFFLVLFDEAVQKAAPGGERRPAEAGPAPAPGPVENEQVGRLQHELIATKEYLQSIIEELEGSNEELKAANEEVVSSNEELQSTNEELQTAKEELQATNEELTTVNEELQNRNLEAAQLTNDLTNLLSSVQLPIIMIGPDLCIRRFTPSAGRALHVAATDVGRPIADIKSKINVPDLGKLVMEVADTFSAKELEVQDFDGRWCLLSIRPYRTTENKIDGAVVVVQDIDALKRSEQVIKESRDFAQAIVDTVREPLVVLDSQMRVKRANRSFYQAFRVNPQDTENRLIYELSKGEWQIPRLRTLLEAVVREDSQFHDFQVDHEFPGLGHRTLLLNARRVRQEGDKTPLILLALEDITERERYEAALRESESRFRAIVDTAAEGIITLNDDQNVLSSNKAAEEMFGYSSGEMTGKKLSLLMPALEPTEPGHAAGIFQAKEGQEKGGKVLETMGRRLDGAEFPLQLAVSEVPGQNRFFACLVRDVSALKEAQARALQAERLAAIGQVSAGLAHESRNALQRSQASLEMLRREVKDQAAAIQFIDQLQKAQDDLLHLYEGVREYAAPLKLRSRLCRLDDVLHEAWEQLQPMREGRAVHFQLDSTAADTSCLVDPSRMVQVFRNILENSLLACTDPVQIGVSLSDAKIDGRAGLSIVLRNNGPPLTWEERRKIFDAFFTTRTHGSGLGMAIVKRIVEAHGGRIAVGAPEHQETEVVITLPRGTS